MKPEQNHPPKYWIVHDKGTDDVFLRTAHKSKNESEELFVVNILMNNFKYDNEEDAWESYYDNKDTYECILVEIKEVKL